MNVSAQLALQCDLCSSVYTIQQESDFVWKDSTVVYFDDILLQDEYTKTVMKMVIWIYVSQGFGSVFLLNS